MTVASKAEAIHRHAKTIDRLCVEIEATIAALVQLEPEYRAELTDADSPERGGDGFSGFAHTARHQLTMAVAGQWITRGNRSLAEGLTVARPHHFPKATK